jgi:hypothetical protein
LTIGREFKKRDVVYENDTKRSGNTKTKEGLTIDDLRKVFNE